MNPSLQNQVQILTMENRQLRQQVAILADRKSSQLLWEKVFAAAVTACIQMKPTPLEAMEYAQECADAMIILFNRPQQKPSDEATDHEMNQRP